MEKATLSLPKELSPVALFGPADTNLRAIERAFPGLEITLRGSELHARGERGELSAFEKLIAQLVLLVQRGQEVTPDGLQQSLKILRGNSLPAEVLSLNILSNRGKTIRPKTSRIILTRPAVEAGERLGFLPGTLHEKIDPYLRPLFDALHDMMDPDAIPKLVANGTIEIAPLAYMRGRTLNDSFIILDEAQNTSPEQMKMFLTRLGFGSKMVITGDVTQIDLPSGVKSGLKVVRNILDNVVDLEFVELTSEDVVRHKIVADIVEAYERFDQQIHASRPLPIHKDR
ncbi:MAG: phosphate starvation-inducible protein PhoH [Actinobacteria bacterium]|uniref:PhoH-like protein n=1 Tax=Candidatus Fonsibacter lacus TaxID=2576439 RepID=A0A965GC36_9PROT|nr:phosphate starvation-inducible protein PhoH [Candidatus Fonsibacter lacus]